MKKILTLAVILISTISLSAATSGSLTLTGTVNGVLDISVQAEAAATNLDLLTSQTDLLIATVVEKSNKAGGYTVSLDSANAVSANSSTAQLKGTGSNTDVLDYTLTYGGSAVSFTNGQATVTDSSATTGASGVSKELKITYTADSGLTEGTYNDTLIFTIAAK